MLKRIPKSDISIRPFKAYKKWSFIDSELSVYEANVTSSELSNGYPKNSIYGQLKAQFYNEYIDNPFLRFGAKSTNYANGAGSERYLSDDAKIITIPQIYVGEGIKKGSVLLNDNGTNYIDDSYGNLIGAAGDTVDFSIFNVEGGNATFTDTVLFETYNILVTNINFETGVIQGTYNSDPFSANMVSFNLETGNMVVDNFDFLSGAAGSDKAGNIFYNQGLIVLTRNTDDKLNSSWDLSFKSTKTIYEHEYLLIVNSDEFNISQNPSAIKEVGFEYEYITGSDGRIYKTVSKTGARYIRKKVELENGETLDYRYSSSVNQNVLAGFEHWDISGSVDSTGSFLAPFITTIGLYDDNCDLVAVAKLPQPIKSEPDFPVNFIVRFDI
jgi:hypothetical protein